MMEHTTIKCWRWPANADRCHHLPAWQVTSKQSGQVLYSCTEHAARFVTFADYGTPNLQLSQAPRTPTLREMMAAKAS